MIGWREALFSMRPRVIAGVWLAAVLLGVSAALWLQIPDSHVWQFAFSMLTGVCWIALLLYLWSLLSRQIVAPTRMEPWWSRWAIVAGAVIVMWLLQFPIDALAGHKELYAGYWSSRLPSSMRGLKTYEHLTFLQTWFYGALRMIAVGLLLPVALIGAAHGVAGTARAVVQTWSKWWYWVAVLISGWIGVIVGNALLQRTPGGGLTKEILSLASRLGFVFTIDVILACFVLYVARVAGNEKPLSE